MISQANSTQAQPDRRTGRVLAATVAGFLLLVLAGLLTIVAALRSAEAERLVAHTIEVRQSLQHLFSVVQDLRIAQPSAASRSAVTRPMSVCSAKPWTSCRPRWSGSVNSRQTIRSRRRHCTASTYKSKRSQPNLPINRYGG